MKSANRVIFCGRTRSGKTTRARDYIRAMRGRVKRLVVVNFKRELAELCEGRYVVESGANCAPVISRALSKHRNVFFYVEAPDRQTFMDALCRELMRLEDILLVCDEAHLAWQRGELTTNQVKVFTQGAGAGINTALITQTLVSQAGNIDPLLLKQCSHLVSFQLTESNEVSRFSEYVPELGEGVRQLAQAWKPIARAPGEYVVKNFETLQCGVAARSPRDPLRLVWLPLTRSSSAGVYAFLNNKLGA